MGSEHSDSGQSEGWGKDRSSALLLGTAAAMLLVASCAPRTGAEQMTRPDLQPRVTTTLDIETAGELAEAEEAKQAIASHAFRLATKYTWGAGLERTTDREYHTALVRTQVGDYHFQAAYANSADADGPIDPAYIDHDKLVDFMVQDDAGTVLLRATNYNKGIEPMLFAGGLNRRHPRGWGLSANPPLIDVPSATPEAVNTFVAQVESRLDSPES